jgi:hypothetical protein
MEATRQAGYRNMGRTIVGKLSPLNFMQPPMCSHQGSGLRDLSKTHSHKTTPLSRIIV